MSNIEGRTFYEKVTEWSVPLRDGECTARDVSDLLRRADKTAEEIDPKTAKCDDAYYVKADEDRLFVQFRAEWTP